MFDCAVDALATRGRLIVIGLVSDHQTPAGLSPEKAGTLPAKLREKSDSIQGFFLNHCLPELRGALDHLLKMYAGGQLVCEVDAGGLVCRGQVYRSGVGLPGCRLYVREKTLGKLSLNYLPLSRVSYKSRTMA